MATIDWTPEEQTALKPGTYYVEVKDCEERRSKNGAAYFNVELAALDHGKAKLCYDIIMLEGRGRGIGQAKLKALGVAEGTETLAAAELRGRRAYAAVIDDEYDGKKRLKVDISADESWCGYWPEGSEPADTVQGDVLEAAESGASADLDDTPF